MIRFFNTFTKITAWSLQKLCFKTKIYYEDKKLQSRKIKGPAIIVSNHTSVYDYAVILFVFPTRTLRYQMAEVLFKKKGLKNFLKCMGGIFVDRDSYDYSFIDKSKKILEKKGVVGIFPEGRLPLEGEETPIPFKPGAVQLALSCDVPIIPLYTNGSYFKKQRARVIIGKPINIASLYDDKKDYRTNVEDITNTLRDKIISLEKLLSEKTSSAEK